MVDIWMVTYNHAPFIEKAIESIVCQETNFSYKIIVGDDHSTDGTQELLLQLKKKYPNKLQLILRDKNIGPAKNAIDVYKSCTAKYIAMCEGDDYWTHPNKLQKQFDFLESDDLAVGCFHDSVVVDKENSIIAHSYFDNNGKFEFDQTMALKELQSSYATSSLMFKREALMNEMELFQEMPSDFMLDFFLTEKGTLHYIEENMSAYRLHSAGIWQGKNDRQNLAVHLKRYKYLYEIEKYKKRHGTFLRSEIFSHYQVLHKLAGSKEEKMKLEREKNEYINFKYLDTYPQIWQRLKKAFRYRLKAVGIIRK
ncbi:glycosyltransferase [Sungkyunkwania multivorans]|uniref:Glycosyltransferase n=1 Tax=Sungkyunkwania multivorans TaxID=1173618 RepID=A0ABW3D4K4_9FLAO